MTPPFRYPDEDWQAVEACLTKLVPHAGACALLRQQLRQHIEAMVDSYLRRMALSDPRSPEQIAVKACWARIAKHAQALLAAVDKLEAIDPWRESLLRLTVAFAANPANPITQHADYLAWKNQNAEAARLAAREMKGLKKSAHGSNRSRGRAVDHLFEMLLTLWVNYGGRVGKGNNSPSTRFVVAAVGRVLSATVPDVRLPGAVVDFVRVGFRAPKTSL
jgi:hypothetical protein